MLWLVIWLYATSHTEAAAGEHGQAEEDPEEHVPHRGPRADEDVDCKAPHRRFESILSSSRLDKTNILGVPTKILQNNSNGRL